MLRYIKNIWDRAGGIWAIRKAVTTKNLFCIFLKDTTVLPAYLYIDMRYFPKFWYCWNNQYSPALEQAGDKTVGEKDIYKIIETNLSRCVTLEVNNQPSSVLS